MHLFETHVPVKNTETARSFYQEIVGLEFAHRDPVRDIVFLWIGSDRRSMVGLHAYPHSSAVIVCDLPTEMEVADGARQG